MNRNSKSKDMHLPVNQPSTKMLHDGITREGSDLSVEDSFSISMGMKRGVKRGVQVRVDCRAPARSSLVIPCTLFGGGVKLMGK